MRASGDRAAAAALGRRALERDLDGRRVRRVVDPRVTGSDSQQQIPKLFTWETLARRRAWRPAYAEATENSQMSLPYARLLCAAVQSPRKLPCFVVGRACYCLAVR